MTNVKRCAGLLAGIGMVAGTLAMVGGCVIKTTDLKPRASKDMECPRSDLKVTHRWNNGVKSQKIEGCGKVAVYEEACESSEKDGETTTTCKWTKVQ